MTHFIIFFFTKRSCGAISAALKLIFDKKCAMFELVFTVLNGNEIFSWYGAENQF